MSKIIFIAAVALLAASVIYLNHHSGHLTTRMRYESWKQKHQKFYSPAEDEYRYRVYAEKIAIFEAHNADPTQTYKMGENQFTAMTEEEFASIYLTYRRNPHPPIGVQEYIPTNQSVGAADWSTLTRVKDQGSCGSCWAFSAVGAVESYLRIKKINTDELSEQQLVDCDTNSYGCDGGFPDLAIGWAAKKGLVKASEYPYVARDQTCKKQSGTIKPNGYKRVSAANLKAAINDYPVSVCVDASNWSSYASGVFKNCAKSLNHAVLATGYKDDGTWVIKNSWSKSWGEGGFIRLAAGDTCGVTEEAAIAY